MRERETGPNRVLTLLEVEADNAEASPYEPVWVGQERVGFITSAAYGHTCQRSLALAYLPPRLPRGRVSSK